MSAVILDGKGYADKIKHRLKGEVADFTKRTGHIPGLAVVLVGDNPASKAYVASKEKSLTQVGMRSFHHDVSAEVSAATLKNLIKDLGQDPGVDGILVQLPLPKGMDEREILDVIPPDKDADGFHPQNLGLMLQGRAPVLPCTPLGVIKLLEEYNIPIRGKNAVVVGRSLIVGKPMGMLLLEKDATVSYAHSRTADLGSLTRQADIIVVACGIADLLRGDMVDATKKPVVIDVGMNRVGGKLVGDVSFQEVSEKAGFITPVPGGVGPLTVACLLENTFALARQRRP